MRDFIIKRNKWANSCGASSEGHRLLMKTLQVWVFGDTCRDADWPIFVLSRSLSAHWYAWSSEALLNWLIVIFSCTGTDAFRFLSAGVIKHLLQWHLTKRSWTDNSLPCFSLPILFTLFIKSTGRVHLEKLFPINSSRAKWKPGCHCFISSLHSLILAELRQILCSLSANRANIFKCLARLKIWVWIWNITFLFWVIDLFLVFAVSFCAECTSRIHTLQAHSCCSFLVNPHRYYVFCVKLN